MLVVIVKRPEFKQVVHQAIEQLTAFAEKQISRSLPREFCFSWIGKVKIVADGDVAEFLTNMAFVDESNIYPCFDLFLEDLLPDGRLLLMGYRAGFPPREFGELFYGNGLGHGAGQVGPFKLGCGNFVARFTHNASQ
ncbi:MAG TPA: hypothetical protein VFC78_22250 [Tepidisphaeraceae bacterium]|nr:hypothetical protein [Tepidisphaeraceae bacterium]